MGRCGSSPRTWFAPGLAVIEMADVLYADGQDVRASAVNQRPELDPFRH